MDRKLITLLSRPRYWLMVALPWPSDVPPGGMAEASFFLSPPTIGRRTREAMPEDAIRALDVVEDYAVGHPRQRLVWFTDVTRWLEWEKQLTWADMGVDWQQALAELENLQVLSMYLQISQRAYLHLTNTARIHEVFYADGSSEILTDQEREWVRSALTDKLTSVWPPYVRDMAARGRLH